MTAQARQARGAAGARAGRWTPLRAALMVRRTALLAPLAASAQATDYRAIFGGAPPRATDPAAGPAQSSPPAEPTMVRRTAANATLFRERLEALLRAGGGAPRHRPHAGPSPDGSAGYFAGVALVTAILILIGRAFVALYALYIARPLMVHAQRSLPPAGIAGKLPVLALRMALTVGAVAIVVTVATALGLWLVESHPPGQATAAIILGGYGLFILVDTVWRMMLGPYLPEYRIPHLHDVEARRLYI